MILVFFNAQLLNIFAIKIQIIIITMFSSIWQTKLQILVYHNLIVMRKVLLTDCNKTMFVWHR